MCDEEEEALELSCIVGDPVNQPKFSLKIIDLSIKLNTSVLFEPTKPLLGENTTEKHAYVQEKNTEEFS